MWPTTTTKDFAPSRFSELLRVEHHCPQPVWLISFAEALSSLATVKNPQRRKLHWLRYFCRQTRKATCSAVKALVHISLSLFWLVNKCLAFPARQLTHQQTVSHHRLRCCHQLHTCCLGPGLASRLPNHYLRSDIWSSGGQQLHRVMVTQVFFCKKKSLNKKRLQPKRKKY